MAVRKREVQADAKRWILPRERDGFVESRFVDHQTGGRENAFTMGTDHGLVDARREAEVIGVDDQSPARALKFHNWVTSLRNACAAWCEAGAGFCGAC